MKLKIKHLLLVAGIILGACAGFIYQQYYSCTSGMCLITANPVNASIYGAVTGGLFSSMLSSWKTKNKNTI